MWDFKPGIVGLLLFFTFLAGRAGAQLSPGDLSNAHKDLEGMSKCTQCHDLGSKVSNDKCLSCHQEIKTRIDRNKGFHVSREVKGKDCASCHSDHHGRNFDLVRFDEKKFDHKVTGYELTGGHQKIDCRQCHQPDFVAEVALKKKKESFLGLEQACVSCHQDRHQKTLGNDCAKCHTTEAFKPAGKFNHDKTDFALAGKHKTVACLECHKKETKNGAEFQRFADVPFKNCSSCHQDVHGGHLGTNCRECHTEQSFTALDGLQRFNHSKTPFPLKGKHAKVNCRECHQLAATPLTVFQDRHGVKTDNCAVCHKDVHDKRLGDQCADCHQENSFRKVENLTGFDHDRTDYALEGKHEAVDCRKCHISDKMTDPLPHNTCATCHKDYHESQFVRNGLAPDCGQCHTVDGFSGSLFTLEDHNKTKFPLEGAHVATPCFACHQLQEKWKFRGIGERCVDCHKDVHGGQIDAKWYPNQACEQCHQTTSWQDNRFDHRKTAFQLAGVHAKQDCRACHVPEPAFPYGRFAGLPAACASCHENTHERQFEVSGVTDCARCHDFDSWTMHHFDHNKTKFQLDGKHIKVACSACHQAVTVGDKTFVQYKFKSFECVVCHR